MHRTDNFLFHNIQRQIWNTIVDCDELKIRCIMNVPNRISREVLTSVGTYVVFVELTINHRK